MGLVIVAVSDGRRRNEQLERVFFVHVQLSLLNLLLQLLHFLPLRAVNGKGKIKKLK
jgi:hypothetical protein